MHGGGYFFGASSQEFYDASVLSAVGDVIVVSVNYRLGVFGFLHTGDDRMLNGK